MFEAGGALLTIALAKARQPLLHATEMLFDLICQRSDLGPDVRAQQLEGCDGCERDERCGDGVFRQFKTGFIAKESLNHLFAPLECG
jgi:hypothetical protein